MGLIARLRSRAIEIRKKRRVGRLTTQLEDKNIDVRKEAAEGLGEIKDHCSVRPLIATLKDRSP
ncbi:MAG: hypothetical protein JRI43_05780, partial [Deltaproteobacteria bacterium]|nr:hypothetical protein [Deltaproteobacteria bacterium]